MKIKALDDDAIIQSIASIRFSLGGCITSLLPYCAHYSESTFGKVINHINSALRHRQAKCFFDENGTLVGLLIWMLTTKEVVSRIRVEDQFPPTLHISEWKEGKLVCILDLIAFNRSFKEIVRYIESEFAHKKLVWIDWRKANKKLYARRLRGSQLGDDKIC